MTPPSDGTRARTIPANCGMLKLSLTVLFGPYAHVVHAAQATLRRVRLRVVGLRPLAQAVDSRTEPRALALQALAHRNPRIRVATSIEQAHCLGQRPARLPAELAHVLTRELARFAPVRAAVPRAAR
jgi:hypothetical protein